MRVVGAGCVLDPAEVALHTDADAVVGVGELETCRVVVVEGLNCACNASVILKTSVSSYEQIN